MEDWIDLSQVPTFERLSKNGKPIYDWKNASGCECNFLCQGITDSFVIECYERDKQGCIVNYNGKKYFLYTSYIINNLLRTMIGIRNKDFKVEVGTLFKNEKQDMTIIGRDFIPDSKGTKRKSYKYHCNICGFEGWIEEGHLLNKVGCSCCRKVIIISGVNDVVTTDPWMVKYFVNPEDATKTTSCNKKMFLMKCPFCGEEKMYSTDKLSNVGFACPKCGDGISYNEKFMYSFLSQLGVDFVFQLSKKTFSWCENYRYDFYLPAYNMIIETHGRQHYDSTSNFYSYRPDVDIAKEQLAKENGISHYIIIDCRKSNSDFIRNSILNSELPEILNIDSLVVDWVECDKSTMRSVVYDICEYKNKHPELSTTDISKVFPFNKGTIKIYLQRGRDIGICIYDPEIEKHNKSKHSRLQAYQAV